MEKNTTQIERSFQVVCSSLPNEICPTASDCAADQSVVKTEAAADSASPPMTAAPKSSSKPSKGER